MIICVRNSNVLLVFLLNIDFETTDVLEAVRGIPSDQKAVRDEEFKEKEEEIVKPMNQQVEKDGGIYLNKKRL